MENKRTIGAEIKRNLLGGLEVALFMPLARKRFGKTKNEAIRSFIVPVLLFPVTLATAYMVPQNAIAGNSLNIVLALYALRMLAIWTLFFGAVYWIARGVDRMEHFYQFVIASNWLSVPATAVFVPVFWMLLSGSHGWAELAPFMMCLMFYTYAFTGFMAAYVLRVPWELAGSIVCIAIVISNSTLDVIQWVGMQLL
ncbi:MAG: hypothetical protein H6867_05285 [Rhodospirillales bacterium]|nr:hypothetical protein [Rhodospirillales bacterium]MCB9994942.1 hypothetical protein [Rhodospirillales bacterium]